MVSSHRLLSPSANKAVMNLARIVFMQGQLWGFLILPKVFQGEFYLVLFFKDLFILL